jgi:hypothetical protein
LKLSFLCHTAILDPFRRKLTGEKEPESKVVHWVGFRLLLVSIRGSSPICYLLFVICYS